MRMRKSNLADTLKYFNKQIPQILVNYVKEMLRYVTLNQGNHTAAAVISSLARVHHQMTLLISALRDSAVYSTECAVGSPHTEPTLV
jgi:hypothetical protein